MNLFAIQNQRLSVKVDGNGAVLHSICKDATEYLWQGDSKYWKRRDVNLFPYVGRLTEGMYIYNDHKYSLPTHGFCIDTEFQVIQQSDTSIEFGLTDSSNTLHQFPFHFVFRVKYTLDDNQIIKTCSVENRDEKKMYFGLGSHPGFQVPIHNEGAFNDWYLEFPEESRPICIDFDQQNLRLSGTQHDFKLENNRVIPLTHNLFDLDAVVLTNMPREVSLRSKKSKHSVTVCYPQMPFLGLWHAPRTDAPYLCIEPWTSLPSHSAYIENLEKQDYLVALESCQKYENTIMIMID